MSKNLKISEEMHTAIKIRSAELGISIQELTQIIMQRGLEITAQTTVEDIKIRDKSRTEEEPKTEQDH